MSTVATLQVLIAIGALLTVANIALALWLLVMVREQVRARNDLRALLETVQAAIANVEVTDPANPDKARKILALIPNELLTSGQLKQKFTEDTFA